MALTPGNDAGAIDVHGDVVGVGADVPAHAGGLPPLELIDAFPSVMLPALAHQGLLVLATWEQRREALQQRQGIGAPAVGGKDAGGTPGGRCPLTGFC